jgi:hypothetical protein
LGGIGNDDKMPKFSRAGAGSLQGQFQAFVNHLWFHRAGEIQAFAHGAGCGQYFIKAKIEGRHDAIVPIRLLIELMMNERGDALFL